MKKVLVIITILTLIFSVTACNNNSTQPDHTSGEPSLSSAEDMTTAASVENTTTAASAEKTDEPPANNSDYTALELIGYQVDETGELSFKYYTDTKDWQQLDDYDLFRQYFFGSWEWDGHLFGAGDSEDASPLIIDDSEKNFSMYNQNQRFWGFYRINENVLAFQLVFQSGLDLFWIDINHPDVMYTEHGGADSGDTYFYLYPPSENTENYKTTFLTKTDAEPNEPENNYLSVFKLYEMSKTYGIDFDMLVDIAYRNEEYYHILHDDWFQFYPVYLVSESEDKLEFKTVMGNVGFINAVNEGIGEFPITYTIEKTNGEWVRTLSPENTDLIEITD